MRSKPQWLRENQCWGLIWKNSCGVTHTCRGCCFCWHRWFILLCSHAANYSSNLTHSISVLTAFLTSLPHLFSLRPLGCGEDAFKQFLLVNVGVDRVPCGGVSGCHRPLLVAILHSWSHGFGTSQARSCWVVRVGWHLVGPGGKGPGCPPKCPGRGASPP